MFRYLDKHSTLNIIDVNVDVDVDEESINNV